MKTCPHCHIQVGGGTYCPLCQSPLTGPDEGEPYFPAGEAPGRRLPLYFKVPAFLMIAAAIVCAAVDFLLQEEAHRHWSLVAAACIVAALLLLRALLLGSRNAPKLLFQILVGAALLCWFCDWFLDWGGLATGTLIPILCTVTLLLNFMFAFVNRRFTENGLIYLLLNIGVGVVPYIGLTLRHTRTPTLWVICLIVSMITFLGLVMFKGRDLWAEFAKRLHL